MTSAKRLSGGKATMTRGVDRRQALGLAAGLAASLALTGGSQANQVLALGPRSLHVLSDGGFTLPMSMLARNVPEADLLALLKEEGLPTEASTSVLNVTLLKDADGWTIFDCGAGANFLPGSGKLAASLEAAGIAKEDVKRVIFTHAHPDHLWGAIDEFDSDLFPNAAYMISAAEWDFWASPDVFSKLPEDRHAFAAGAQRIFKAIAEKTRRIQAGQEVAPGIQAVDTAGHTPGHLAFLVAGGGKQVMVLGDALTHRAISFRHPEWRSGSDTDPDKGAATRKALLDRLVADKTPFIGYHLPSPGLGHAVKQGNAYRFVAGVPA